jgi:hypothetical protein
MPVKDILDLESKLSFSNPIPHRMIFPILEFKGIKWAHIINLPITLLIKIQIF